MIDIIGIADAYSTLLMNGFHLTPYYEATPEGIVFHTPEGLILLSLEEKAVFLSSTLGKFLAD